MNKNMFFGWRHVCSFAYVQTMKSRAMKITLGILCILALLALPVITLIGSGMGGTEDTKIKTVYLCTSHDLIAERFSAGFDGAYRGIAVEQIDEAEKTERLSELKKADDETDYVVLQLLYDEDPESADYGLEMNVIYGENSKITKKDADKFAAYLLDNEERFILSGTGIGEGEMEQLLKTDEHEVYTINSEGVVSSTDEGLDQIEYSFTYGYLMIVMFAVMIAGSKVAELIVTEKTSKVMEYLLTSIKPLALLLGKVISTLLIVFTILAALFLSFGVSLVLNHFVSGSGFWPESLAKIMESGVLQGLTAVNVVFSVVMVLLGFLFYGFIAGLSGATVSKVEELAEGLKLFTFALIIGVYLVIALMSFASAGEGMGTFSYVVYYLPFSSVFIVPVYLLLGRISFSTALISLAILALAVVIVWIFVTKVFESVIYHSGSVMKFQEILAVYKTNAKARKNSEVKNGK